MFLPIFSLREMFSLLILTIFKFIIDVFRNEKFRLLLTKAFYIVTAYTYIWTEYNFIKPAFFVN